MENLGPDPRPSGPRAHVLHQCAQCTGMAVRNQGAEGRKEKCGNRNELKTHHGPALEWARPPFDLMRSFQSGIVIALRKG